MNAPEWWYVVSGIFFGLGTVLLAALIILVARLLQRLNGILERVGQLITKVDAIAVKVDALVAKVSTVTSKVGDQATGAAGSLNQFAALVTQRAEWVSIAVIILGAVRGLIASRKAK